MRTGTANLPLHYGRAPRWLFGRMTRLAGEIASVVVEEHGTEEMLARRTVKIKSFLLDQRFVAGIGNAYADEMLFEARISPTRTASTLSKEEVRVLHANMVRTLRRGLELGGSSEMAFVHLDGSKGGFQEQFKVKGRKGKPCVMCGTPIEKTSVGGRGTYFCPACQS